MLKLAILSDLHIGKAAIARDLCPKSEKGFEGIIEDFVEKFASFVKRKDLRADYLLIPGDVTNAGQPDQVSIGSDVVKRLAESLGVNISNTVVIPGNHDVDWAVASLPDTTGFRIRQRYAPLIAEDWVFSDIFLRSIGPGKCITQEPHAGIWDFDKLVVVGYNTSFRDTKKELEHYGAIDVKHLANLRSCLEGMRTQIDKKFRVFLIHHHAFPPLDPSNANHDSSILNNAPELIQILNDFQFDMLISGHTHRPSCETLKIGDTLPFVHISASTFSMRPSSEPHAQLVNHFHIANIAGRDPAESAVHGFLESWAFHLDRGWIGSEEVLGILPKVPFGPYVYKSRVCARLKRHLVSVFAGGKQATTMAEVFKQVPELGDFESAELSELVYVVVKELGIAPQGHPADPETVMYKVPDR